MDVKCSKLHKSLKIENGIVSSILKPLEDETKSIPTLILESISLDPSKVYVVSKS